MPWNYLFWSKFSVHQKDLSCFSYAMKIEWLSDLDFCKYYDYFIEQISWKMLKRSVLNTEWCAVLKSQDQSKVWMFQDVERYGWWVVMILCIILFWKTKNLFVWHSNKMQLFVWIARCFKCSICFECFLFILLSIWMPCVTKQYFWHAFSVDRYLWSLIQ